MTSDSVTPDGETPHKGEGAEIGTAFGCRSGDSENPFDPS